MAALFRKTAEEQRLLPHREKSVPPPAAVLRNRRERTAIGHRDAPATFVNRHRRAGEVFKRHLTHPGIGGIFHRDGKPRMIFILRILRVEGGFEPQIFHADIFNPSRPRIRLNSSAAEIGFHRRRDRRVNRHKVAINFLDDTIPSQIAAAGLPDEPPIIQAAAEFRHAERVNPRLRAGTNYVNRIADLQTTGVLHMKTRCAGGAWIRDEKNWQRFVEANDIDSGRE